MGLTIRVPGKVVFLVPWPDHWLIGTTDAPFDGPAERPSAAGWEVDRLLDTVNSTMDVDLTRDDVVGTYAGLRPLIAPSDGSTVKASREHRVSVESNGVVRIGGGKYTTYRVMARDVIDAVLGPAEAKRRPSVTAERPLVGAADPAALARIAGELSTIPAVREIGAGDRDRDWSPGTGRRRRPSSPWATELDLVRPLVPGRALPRGGGRLGRPPRTGSFARRRPRAPDAARPGAPRSRRGHRATGRRDPWRRARLGRRRGSARRSTPISPPRGASTRSRRPGPPGPADGGSARSTEVTAPSSSTASRNAGMVRA